MTTAPALPGNGVLRSNAPAWIKRRARRLVRAFQIDRREAVATAWQDWSHFHPNTHGAARQTQHVKGF